MRIAQELALIRFVQAAIGRPFAWGQCDCNVFALEAIDAAVGTDLAGRIRGHYSTALGAIRYRRRSPWGTFTALLQEAGFIEARKGFEQMGDLLVVPDPRWEMVHVGMGRHAAAAFPEQGVRIFPLAAIRREPYQVWRGPCLP